MGLDFDIYAIIHNIKTDDAIDINLGYWRKCYSLTDRLFDFARNSEYALFESEYSVTCYPEILTDLCDKLCESISNRYDKLWSNSILDSENVRANTAKMLHKFCILDSVLNPLFDEPSDDVLSAAASYLNVDEAFLLDVVGSRQDYEISIEFYMSY